MPTENPPPTQVRPRWRRRILGGSLGVTAVLVAAWYCFRAVPPPERTGTVRTVEISDGEFILQSLSHPVFGNGAIAMSFDETTSDIATFRFVSEQGLEIDLLAPSGITTLDGQEAEVLSVSSTDAVLWSPTGVVVFLRPNEPPRVVYLKCPEAITPAPETADTELLEPLTIEDLYVMEASLVSNELRLLCTGSDDRGAIVRYVLDFDAPGGEVVSASSCDEILDVSFMSYMDAATGAWHSLDASVFWKTVDQQTLTCSEGTTIDLPVVTLNASTSSLYFALTGSPRDDHLTAVRTTADQQNIEVIEVDLDAKKLSDRPPLKLPTRYINTEVSGLSPDGRYIVISSRDYRSTMLPLVSQFFPTFQRATVACDLVLVDLVEWRVAGSERITRQSVGRQSPSAWRNPTFDHTGKEILLPQEGGYCVIDVETFIRETTAATNVAE